MKPWTFAATLLVGLAACDGVATTNQETAPEAVTASEEAVSCQPTELSASACAGPWEYHEKCTKVDDSCPEDPNGTCVTGNSCDVVNGSRAVTEYYRFDVPQECDIINNKPKCHRDDTGAKQQCATAAQAAYQREYNNVVKFKERVTKSVSYEGSSSSGGWLDCHITIGVPTWTYSQNDSAHCGCAHHVHQSCTVPPQKCDNPPLRYSRSGLTFAQVTSETMDQGAVCLTADNLGQNAAAIYDRLAKTWERLGIVDGGFEQQPTRNPVTAPWYLWGGGGIDIGLGYATYERNNGFLWAESNQWADLHQTIPVVPGQTYTAQAFVKAESNMRSGYFGVRTAGQGGTMKETTFGSVPGYGASVSVTFTAPANTYNLDLYIGMWGDSNAGRWVQIDGVAMQPVNGVYSDPLHQLVVRKLRALYNLYGGQLDPTRLAGLRRLAYDAPGVDSVPLTCGDATNPPAVPDCEFAPAYRQANAIVQRCSMLAQPPLDVRLASREVLSCIDNLNALGDQLNDLGEAGPDGDAACNGPAIRDFASKVVLDLLRRQFDVMVAAGASPNDAELAQLGHTGRQLALLDAWYRAAEYAGIPEKTRLDGASYALRGFWDAVYKQKNPFASVRAALGDTSHPATSDSLTPLLHDLTQTAFRVEQDVLTAAFTNLATIPYDGRALGRTPLAGAPLLLLTADGLGALARRVDDMSVFHDFGCTFRTDCPTAKNKTPIASAWKLLASLGKQSELSVALAGVPALSGWRDVFTTIATNHAQLAAALPPEGLLTSVDEQLLPRPQRDLAVIVRLAARRTRSFELTGQFDPVAERTLAFGVDVDQRNAILNEVRGAYTAFSASLTTYNHELVTSLSSLINVVNTQADAQHLTVEKLRIADRRDALDEDYAGLAAANDADEHEFADIVQRFETIKASIDSGVYAQVGNTLPLSFTGASVAAQAGGNVGNMLSFSSVPKLPNLEAGQMLQIAASGDYRPSCALRNTRLLSPVNGDPSDTKDRAGASGSEAIAGPEGYALSWSNGRFEAYSHTVAGTESLKVGTNHEICAGAPGFVTAVTGVSARGCVYAGYDYTKSWSVSNSDGSQNNTSASFSAGLRLPGTPFPTMPAGALLVVFADRTTGAIADVKVLAAGNNALVVPGANLSAYFVVNDATACPGAYDTSRTLAVTARVMQDAVGASRPLLGRMALVLKKMRALEASVVAQGRILPSQAAASRSEALSVLDATAVDAAGNPTGGASLDNVPPEVHRLFEAFVDRQLLRTERLVEMKQIGREEKLLELELRNLIEDTQIGADRSRLQALVTRWAARNLDTDKLRNDAVHMLRLTRSYFLPILELWYPAAIESFRNLTEVNNVLDADITTSVPDMAHMIDVALTALGVKFGDAARGQKLPAEEYTWVAVSIPNPYYGQLRSYPRTGWARGEATQAYTVWDAIHQRRTGRITIRPEDIYGQGDFRLGCKRHNPVIQKIGLYVVRPGEPDFAELNSPQRDFEAVASPTEVFAQTAGPVTYTLSSDEYNSFELPIIYGESLDLKENSRPKLATQQAVGLSPFTSFDVDFSEISAIENGDPGSGFDDRYASELVVVMQVDSRGSGTAMPWIRACK